MKSLYKILPLAFLCVGLSSCLDEEDPLTDRDTEASPNIIEFYSEDPAEHPSEERIYAEFTRSFDVVPEDTFEVIISYSGKDNAPEDIVVDVMVDAAAIKAFNDKLIADAREAAMADIEDPVEAEEAADEAEAETVIYDLMPSSLYSMPNQVTIKKGERRAILPVIVKPNQFDFAFRYGLPLTINAASTGNISGNFGTAIFFLGAKNAYDGTYTYTTSANTSLVPNANKTVKLVTTGPNEVKLDPGLLGTYSNEIWYTIDPATNKVTVRMPSLGVQTPQDTRSNWDPATKTMTVYWKQGNGNRTFEETFKYKGPR